MYITCSFARVVVVMPTLILPPRFTDDTNLVRKAAIEAGWAVERLSGWRAPAELRDADPVLYGEPLFAAVVADSLGLALIEPPFNWLTTVPAARTRRHVRFMSLGDARGERSVFIKPADDKCFRARVYNSGDELPDASVLPDGTPVLVAEPVHWTLEFRCFVLNRQLETLSVYSRDGELAEASDGTWPATDDEVRSATTFIWALIGDAECGLPPAVVVDIGLIDERGWAVVESNPAWGSGIYGCDPRRVLNVLRRACVRRDQLSADDAAWIPTRAA